MVNPLQMSKVEILNKEDRIFTALGSVAEVDTDGEYISMKEFKRVMPVVMKRGGFLIDSHSNRVIGKILNYEFVKNEEGKDAVKLTNQVFKDYPVDDAVWEGIKDGTRKGLSFGGSNLTRTFDAAKNAFDLKGVSGYEFSVVDEPANQGALIQSVNFFAKGERKKGSICMGILEGRGITPEESHDICYADEIEIGTREAQTKVVKEFIEKPAKLDRCVEDLIADPDFKPHDSNQTKEQAAFAVCTAAIEKVRGTDLKKVANYLSKHPLSKSSLQSTNNAKGGENTMTDTKKIKKQDESPAEESPERSMEERVANVESMLAQVLERIGAAPEAEKADEEEEEKTPEEEEEKAEHEDEEEETEKQGSGETVTSTDVPQDKDEVPPKTDSTTVIKSKLASENAALKKELSEIKKGFKKVKTPRPAAGPAGKEIAKESNIAKGLDPLAVAQGRKVFDMRSIHNQQNSEMEQRIAKGLGYTN